MCAEEYLCVVYLQDMSCGLKGNCLLSFTMIVKGKEAPRIMSENARLKMKMFLAVHIFFFLIIEHSKSMLNRTENEEN